MTIQMLYYETLTEPNGLEGVWSLLCRYDTDFIPPLSSRENTYQTNLSALPSQKQQPKQYFETLKEQSFILALDGEVVVGFVSFRPHYLSQDIDDGLPTLYVTTIIVEETYRGQGITTRFYAELAKIANHYNQPIMTRTWSTNDKHIRVLHKIGMEEIKRIQNGRGLGLDTVYYRQRMTEESARS
ncbi:GNAT family N-acetyltransferase [Paenibacillus xylaniclasticus]|uniref:GNAT family N-acetyltransferase n=1 Tax=Paenibacillus xylaniclasticus TaxID=588083 RepID=UPI000FDBED19|nr:MULTISPECIES: GNAT family N-acetyltransferase [Paenibacillus]GFN33487.1 hypothetical protein PCURB6_37470 [Paenibacillus curdlanolyticus]